MTTVDSADLQQDGRSCGHDLCAYSLKLSGITSAIYDLLVQELSCAMF